MNPKLYAILDERGTKEHTITVHYQHKQKDLYTNEETDRFWTSWRVRFPEAKKIISLLTFKVEFYEDVFSKSDRFVGDDGIFPVEYAIDEMGKEEIAAGEEDENIQSQGRMVMGRL